MEIMSPCARDRNRTDTAFTGNRILSPARLPVPPPGQTDELQNNIFYYYLPHQNSFKNSNTSNSVQNIFFKNIELSLIYKIVIETEYR